MRQWQLCQATAMLIVWQIDPLSGVNPVLNAVAMAAANNPAAVGGVGGYPGGLAASLSGTAPGSPARNFSQLGQITQPQGPSTQQPGFPGLPAALSSQLQGRFIPCFLCLFIICSDQHCNDFLHLCCHQYVNSCQQDQIYYLYEQFHTR